MITEARRRFGDVETRVLSVAGSADGVPIVLLHGYADSADTWRPVLERFAAAGRHALSVDLPGFGHCPQLDNPAEVVRLILRVVARVDDIRERQVE